MKGMPQIFRLVLWLILGVSCIAAAQAPDTSTFRTMPSPPPADQPFDAVFGVVMHEGVTGFHGIYPQYRVQDKRVDILFDIGCGFPCPSLGSTYYLEYPLVMPALSAGSYTVRFSDGDFDDPSRLLAEFPMVVGGSAPPAQLPAGDLVPWLLGLLLIFAALARLRLKGAPFAKLK